MIYLFRGVPGEPPAQVLQAIPECRRVRAERYLREADRNRCLMAYYLFYTGAVEEFGLDPESLEWEYNDRKRPFLKLHPDVFFNISHCDTGVVCIVDHCNAGIDIQHYDRRAESVARRAFSVNENTYLKSLIGDEEAHTSAFYDFWCAREAYYKYLGTGLDDSMNRLDFSRETGRHFEKYGCRFSRFHYGKFNLTVCGEKYYDDRDIVELK